MSTPRVYAGQSLEDRQAGRRVKLIEAGLELFGTVGRTGTSVRAVCREAGLTDRYFYEQFPTIEDLLLAVLDECAERLQAAVLAGLEGAETIDALARQGLDAFLAVAEQDPRVARVAWLEALGAGERVDQHYLALNERFAALILMIATEELGGDPSDPRNQLIASAAAGGIKETIVHWIMNDFTPPRRALVDPLADFLLALQPLLAR